MAWMRRAGGALDGGCFPQIRSRLLFLLGPLWTYMITLSHHTYPQHFNLLSPFLFLFLNFFFMFISEILFKFLLTKC